MRDRRHREAEGLQQRARRVEVGYEVRDVVENQVARRRTLLFVDRYFSPPRPSERLITSFMISLVPP